MATERWFMDLGALHVEHLKEDLRSQARAVSMPGESGPHNMSICLCLNEAREKAPGGDREEDPRAPPEALERRGEDIFES